MVQITSEDRISTLSNTLLSIILSFLDTKAAVRTSLLSKRWKNVWTKVPILDLSPCNSPNKSSSSFISFVYKALLLNDVPKLKLFRLNSFDSIKDFHLYSWIWSLMKRNVVEISLCSINRETNLIEGLFLGDSLKVLNLTGKFVFHATVIHFKLPNLEILNLSSVILKHSMSDISSIFPRLRELVLHNWSGIKNLHIHSYSLKKLKIRLFMLPAECFELQDIVIEAPNVEYLFISDNVSYYDIKGVGSLIEARINVCKQSCGMPELLQQISGLSTLQLSIATIYQCLGKFYPHELPMFHNLTCLEMADSTLSLALHMLDHTPNLVSLILHNQNYSEEWMGHWNPPPYSTPNCLTSSLKAIELHDFYGSKDQVRIGEYFLRTAARLRVMKVHTAYRDSEEELRALLMLLRVPRVSSLCDFTICTPGMNHF